MIDRKGEDLLVSLSDGFGDEELCLAGLQAMIAAEISAKRQLMGMNQKQFSKLMGVSQGLVSKWESGETNFTLSSLVSIATKLHLQIQCPFVLPSAPVYYDTNTNIVLFPKQKNSWDTAVSKTTGYDDELQQM